MALSQWLVAWRIVHWVCVGLAIVAALYLLLHSLTFHRLKRRMADLLLSGIALADLSFVVLETCKELMHTSYFARYRREDEADEDTNYSTVDFVLMLLSRFSFFMSMYWITNLSLLMRLGSFEALHVKKSLLLSSLASMVYGCLQAALPILNGQVGNHSTLAYTVKAVLLFLMQMTPLLLILTNLRSVRRSRLSASAQGRNVIRRLTAYCVCAAAFTLPYALVLIFSRDPIAVGAVAETLNYLVPIANALLFGTSLSCCCAVAIERTTVPNLEKVQVHDTPSSSLVVSAGVLTDGCGTPRGTAGSVYGIRDELLAGGLITEMETEGPAVKIGEGSSAEVYKVQWVGITVALKCLRLQARSSSEAGLYMTHLAELRSEFLDEAVLAAQLRHPNITLFIKMGTYKGSLCLVNEYCARGSLRDVLRANPLLDWHTKVRLAFEAAKGLAFMHNREPIYLHRDLKASNILVTIDWTAKIADFGIARIATDFTVKKQHSSQQNSMQSLASLRSIDDSIVMMDTAASGLMTTFAGTWRWNAPEIMNNPNACRFNRETDMYSFGVALWEILTNGAVPFGDVDFDHQVRQLVAAGERPLLPPASLRRAPPKFIEVMRACWHQRPDKRPSAQDVMFHLGSLSYTLSNSSESSISSQNTTRYVFSDTYYQAIDSIQSCPGLWPLNKEWKLFGHKYRVAGAKCAKVDCKACQTQVSAAINRLQSHIRVCPARSGPMTCPRDSSSNTDNCSNTELSDALPTSLELAQYSLEDPITTNLSTEETDVTSDAPPAKKRRQSPSKTRDRPRRHDVAIATNDEISWVNDVIEETEKNVQPAATSVLHKRRLEIEEKRLHLEIKRDQREERRERLELEILKTQARKETLLMEKEGYEARVLLALSRKQLFDQGVDKDEVDRILPILSFQNNFDNSMSATTEIATLNTTMIETSSTSSSSEKDATSEVNDPEAL
ncbi:hypothetical protein KXD40_005417 [Peronospora effusa]|nr:hypothetical protein KXD40_005417 [Peronospora effusa]